MKKILFILILQGCTGTMLWNCCHAQNAINGPTGLYGPQYNAATTIYNGGTVLVGNSGDWFMGGKVISADKGNPDAPSAAGRSETIIFAGSGTYSNAGPANFVDGYAGAEAPGSGFVLPVGEDSFYAPVTIPANDQRITAAYFAGSGTTSSTTVNGQTMDIFSPFIDMVTDNPDTLTGPFVLSYPSGFVNQEQEYVVASVNDGASYDTMASVPAYDATGGSASLTMPLPPNGSRLAFATRVAPLPLVLVQFEGSSKACVITLHWTTETEENISAFDVERSHDGYTFNKAGSVQARGSHSNYYFHTEAAANGIDLFRLKIEDRDGQVVYSNIISINHTCYQDKLSLYPNPVQRQATLAGLTGHSRIRLLNNIGQVLLTDQTDKDRLNIDMGAFSSGVYWLQVYIDNNIIGTLKVNHQAR